MGDIKALGNARLGLEEGSTKRTSDSISNALGKKMSEFIVSKAADAGFNSAHMSIVSFSTTGSLRLVSNKRLELLVAFFPKRRYFAADRSVLIKL